MGVDVEIWVKAKPTWTYSFWDDFRSFVEDREDTDATHRLSTYMRYYGPHYERGDWPAISKVLMDLFADPDVEKVWYFGDHSDILEVSEFTPADFMEIMHHWLLNKSSPYRNGDVERIKVPVKYTAEMFSPNRGAS